MNKQRLIDTFISLVKISSESGQEGNFARHLEGLLTDLGFETSFDETESLTGSDTGNLYAYLPGQSSKTPLAFSMHMDTVTPGVAIVPVITEERITSDGTTILGSDDKSAIAEFLEAVQSMKESGHEHGDIEAIFTVGEEKGLRGSKAFDELRIRAKDILVLDSSGRPGKAIIQAPAQTNLQVTIHGKSAHAGIAPETGISAIQVLSTAISRMKLLRIDEETTANVGMISGGTATNIVAEKATASFEARSLRQEKLDRQIKHMVDTLTQTAEQFGVSASIDVSPSYPPFHADEDFKAMELFNRAAKEVGLEPYFTSTGGGSDANIFRSKGLRPIVLAVGMTAVHSTEEYILIEDLLKTSELVYHIIRNA